MNKNFSAQDAFKVLTNYFNDNGIPYEEDNNILSSNGYLGDIVIQFKIFIDEETKCINFLSPIPITVEEDKKVIMSVAVNYLNASILEGRFKYVIQEGMIFFEHSNVFLNSNIANETIEKILKTSLNMLNIHIDKINKFNKGIIDLNKFVELIIKGE